MQLETLKLLQDMLEAVTSIEEFTKDREFTRGLLRGFSIERLLKFLNMLDRDVIITLRLPEKGQQPGVRVMAIA